MWRQCLVVFIFLTVSLVDCVSFVEKDKLNSNLQVRIINGVIQGRVRGNQNIFYSFQRIPFAEPPVGPLRFKAPQPSQNWTGVLDATEESSSCIELRFRKHSVLTSGEEDCLYLNVFTNQNPKEGLNLPVLVWIYGGAFMEGHSKLEIFGPELFLNEGFMLVTFNYRVGVFGFLSSESIEIPGNFGLKDQNLVLKWIQRNIRQFGGNPGNVTIFGQSAGGASVFYHLHSPKSKGLFHRAIAHSGNSLCGWALKLKPREIFEQILGNLNIEAKNMSEIMLELQHKDVDSLKEAQRLTIALNFLENRKYGLPFSPVLEPNHTEAFLVDYPFESLMKGDFNRVPLLIGLNGKETLVFKFVFQMIKPLIELIYDQSPGMLALPNLNTESLSKNREFGLELTNFYFKRHYWAGSSMEEIVNFFSDDTYLRSTHKAVEIMSKYIPVYFYVFKYEGEYINDGDEHPRKRKQNEKGAAHADELIYLWKSNITLKSRDLSMRKRMFKLWGNFAKKGNPTPYPDPFLGNIIWPVATPEKSMLHLDLNENLTVTENFRNKYVEFWDYLYGKYGRRPFKTY